MKHTDCHEHHSAVRIVIKFLMTSQLYVHCICTPRSRISSGSCLALVTWTWPFHWNDQSTRLDLTWMWLDKYILTSNSILILTLWKWFPCHVADILYFHISIYIPALGHLIFVATSVPFFIFILGAFKYTKRKTKYAYTRVPS